MAGAATNPSANCSSEVVRVRAKMHCTEIRHTPSATVHHHHPTGAVTQRPGIATQLTLIPVYPQGNEETEDNLFANATPSGKVELLIRNPQAAALFVPGQVYYVDITPATPDPEATN